MRSRMMLLAVFGCWTLLFSNFTEAQQVNEPLGDAGMVPTDADGKPLNLNFEAGDLSDWTATGEAFNQQPYKGEIDPKRPFGEGRKSLHTGDYWFGGYEFLRDTPTGSLTSARFIVSQPYASFLLGGGSHAGTRIELVDAESDKVLFKASGKNREEMQPVIVDLNKQQGKEIFIRIVDEVTGGWGHVNFDDFRLHAKKPNFKQETIRPANPVVRTEQYPYENLTGEEAAKLMTAPPGFKVQLAAGEPDVQQPIAMAFDDRGRVWIAEAYEYPTRAETGKGRDRILIFEDTDLDGTLDSRKVFVEGLNLVSGLEIGFGGVWVGAAPYLMFIPDRNGDDVPDTTDDQLKQAGEVQWPQDVPPGATVLLDGFGYQDTHETLNAFIWGPDGWLYGCHGVFTYSRVGKPGTADKDRTPINAGIWRYHPVKHKFEVYAEGTSNPWGLDYNQYGDFFATACVIPHLFHIIPGARYQRQAGQHFNPHTYDDIKTIAKHRHFVGNQWNNNDRAASDDLGGGHAHAGAMIYQGGRTGHFAPEWMILGKYNDQAGWNIPNNPRQGWPEMYHGKLFMNNIHGNRINVDKLIPHGSGYIGDRDDDFLLTGDKWSQMIYMTYGPDGQVYVIDWYDQQQCHHKEDGKHDRKNGRIYRISYGDAKPVKVDLQDVSTDHLLQLVVFSENDWYSRHARRILHERHAAGEFDEKISYKYMENIFKSGYDFKNDRAQMRIRMLDNSVHTDEYITENIRIGNGVRRDTTPSLIVSKSMVSTEPTLLVQSCKKALDLARKNVDAAPRVKLAVASALLRIQLKHRWELLEKLTYDPKDASDHNLPLMYWYAMEPLADVDPQRALALAMTAGENIPILREYMIRRLGSGDTDAALKLLVEGLAVSPDDAIKLTFLKGIRSALKGKQNVQAPEGWEATYQTLTNPETTAQNFNVYLYALGLGGKFGNEAAQTRLREIVVDEAGAYEERKVVFEFLVEDNDAELAKVVKQLLTGTTLRTEALKAAARLNDESVALAVLEAYSTLHYAEQRDALNTLASRPNSAKLMLAAVQKNRINKKDLSADLIRQLRNLNDSEVIKLLESVWGVVRESDADRKALIAKYTQLLNFPSHTKVSAEHGRAIFAKTCQQCHTLFGTGGKVGPDITGANRKSLDYLLSNILDPSAVMANEYQPVVLATDSGRVITGIVKEETDSILSVQTTNELLTVPINEIEARKQSNKSMMPDDLLKNLSESEVRSLIAYLQESGQVAVAATSENVNQLFNGKDLTGWRASREEDNDIWNVDNGEIIGKSAGLKHNSFLISDLSLRNFRFSCEVKLTPDDANSGIQFRSQPLDSGEMRGYQADIGKGWWGKLYEESARGILVDESAAADAVKPGEWNHYEIVAVGHRIRTSLNGVNSYDTVDEQGALKGLLALQVHSGGPTEVRFRNLNIELLDTIPAFAASGSQPGTWPSSKPLEENQKITWEKTTLDTLFRSEGCCVADFNHDGQLDIAAGPMLYIKDSSSTFKFLQHVLNGDQAPEHNPKGYSNSFMNFAEDVNSDGWVDVITVDFPGNQTWWFENPAKLENGETPTPWKRHEITPVTNNESPQYLDINGDGKRELLAGFADGIMGFATPQSHPQALWKINAVGGPNAPGTNRFSHGIGAGDINNDGHNDILCTNGWWKNPGKVSEETWEFVEAPFGQACSQMYVFDFDNDGDADVFSTSAHQYGMWWHERQSDNTWTTHEIDKSFSQTHALVLADINGDGLPDFVTGKRHWAHGGKDPGGMDPAVVYWYEFSRGEDNSPTWTKHQIDDNSGIGTQFEVVDINCDGLLDVVTSNKKGTFLHTQKR